MQHDHIKWQFETEAIRGQIDRTQFGEHSAPIFLTSSFTFPSAEMMEEAFAGNNEALIYSRYGNPNTDELIAKVCRMEKAEAGFATSSGMAAVFASFAAFLKSGDHILACRAIFGSTHQIFTQILNRWGITHSYVDPDRPEQWQQSVTQHTKMFFLETPSNPGLVLADLRLAGAFAKKNNLIFSVDNCFATPYLQTPMDYGADLVIHSGTKWMDGQGRVLGGIVVGKQEFLDPIVFFCRHTGPAMSPFNAWLLSKSLETLVVRMERHCANAFTLATEIEKREDVELVRYPFLPTHPQYALAKQQMRLGGGILAFEASGGKERAIRFINQLTWCSRSSNLGDTRTIVTHPATTTHSKLTEVERLAVGITPGMIRISVGLENAADIVQEVCHALDKSK